MALTRSSMIVLCAVLTALAVVFVILRFYVRKFQQKARFLPDDWLILVALLTFIGACICEWIEYTGPIHRIVAGPKAKLLDQTEIAVDILTFVSLGCTKCSALFFYRRVFRVLSSRIFNILTIISLVIVTLWVVVFCFLAGFQCGTHFTALWSSLAEYNKYCTLSKPFLYGLAVSDFLLDVWIIGLPIPMIVRLHATPPEKVATAGVFLIGLGALAGSTARMGYFIWIEGLSVYAFEEVDEYALLLKTEFFIILENGLSVLAINMTALWPLFSKLTPDSALKDMRTRESIDSENAGPAGAGLTNSDASEFIRSDERKESYALEELGSRS